jgi:hypothetical protein
MPLLGHRRLSFVPMFFLRVGSGLFPLRFGSMGFLHVFFRVLLWRRLRLAAFSDGDDALDTRLDAVKQGFFWFVLLVLRHGRFAGGRL